MSYKKKLEEHINFDNKILGFYNAFYLHISEYLNK